MDMDTYYYFLLIINFNYYLIRDKFKQINYKDFIKKFVKRFEKKLLILNGLSDSDSDSDSDLDSDSDFKSDLDSDLKSDSIINVKEPSKYEDKYIDDIKKLPEKYKFTWEEMKLIDDKFDELYNKYKVDLEKEKYEINQEIIEKSMKYIEIDDDDYENIGGEVNSDDFLDINNNSNNNSNFEKKENKKKEVEEEIILLRSTIQELEDKIKNDDIIKAMKLESKNFVTKKRLDSLKNNFVIEKTPLGNVIMYWNNDRESFEYYSDNTIPYRYLETVGRKYVKTFNCKQIYVDMGFELSESERKKKEEKEKEKEKEKEELRNKLLEKVQKKNVFAKFKNYNTESGTGKVNRGVAPPSNSIPNNNTKKLDDNFILKANANRYTYEGKIVNFNFLKKVDRKNVNKKYAMSFADYKKLQLSTTNKI